MAHLVGLQCGLPSTTQRPVMFQQRSSCYASAAHSNNAFISSETETASCSSKNSSWSSKHTVTASLIIDIRHQKRWITHRNTVFTGLGKKKNRTYKNRPICIITATSHIWKNTEVGEPTREPNRWGDCNCRWRKKGRGVAPHKNYMPLSR